MNSNFGIGVALVAVAIIALGGWVLPVPGSAPVGTSFGGTTNYDDLDADSVTYGRSCLSYTANATLTAQQLADNSCLVGTVLGGNQAVISLTLPATSTMTALIPNQGECREWFVDASAFVAATTTTIVAGTGIDLVGLDATGAGTGADALDGGEYGQLKLCRQPDNNVTAHVTEWINAD